MRKMPKFPSLPGGPLPRVDSHVGISIAAYIYIYPFIAINLLKSKETWKF